jgi:1A family penicillin-binding protein
MWETVKKAVALANVAALVAVIIATCFLLFTFLRVQSNISSIINTDLPQGLQTTKVYASDYNPVTHTGTLLANLYLENREFMPLVEVPNQMVACTLASEDKRFYRHHGVDFFANLRAMFAIARSGSISQGGSTITQQLARNVFLPFIKSEKTLNRKVQEIILAQALEKKFSKDEILESYLNNIFYGAGAYGVKAAAATYFGKDPSALTLGESALLAGLPQRPSVLNPYVNPDGAKERRNEVLARLKFEKRSGKYLDLSNISDSEIEQAMNEPLVLAERHDTGVMRAPYFSAWVRELLYDKYGEDQVLRQGLIVVTSLNWDYQKAAEAAVTGSINKYRTRRVTQGALVSVDVETGNILAMVGGYDYSQSVYNRAVQGNRQVGSAFKPFVYATALSQGMSPSTTLRDLPTDFILGPGQVYSPKNSDGKFSGMINMVYALQHSRNVAAIDLMNRVGPANAVAMAHRMGVKEDLPPVLALPLGVASVKPLEMAGAFACFPRGGNYVEPVPILQVYDRYGVLLEDHTEDVQMRTSPALDPRVAWTMVLMMQRAVTGGTGTPARFSNGAGVSQPTGGKTGTTDDYGDAWFVGYTPKVCTAVWFGNDDSHIKMSRIFGGTIPAPTFRAYMSAVYKARKVESFKPPPGCEKITLVGGSVRGLESLADIQATGSYTFPYRIRAAELPEEKPAETPPGETPATPPDGGGGGDGGGDGHKVYF